MNNLSKISIVLVALVGSFLLGKNQAPTKVNTVEVVKEIRDIEIVKQEVTKPDGSKVVTTTTKDKTKLDTRNETKINKPNWKVSGLVGINSELRTVYGASVDRRIVGNIFVGAWGTTDKTGGISIGLEF